MDQIAASIREWGWTNPVLVGKDGSIIAGHGRVLAARRLRIQQIPVMVAAGWTEAQKRAYALADNKLALNAGWDESMLALEIADLTEVGFDIGLIGFSDDEIAALGTQSGGGLTDPDVSLAASLVLYAAYGLKYPAALNGLQFLAGSFLKKPFRLEDGGLRPPAGPGLGVEVDEEKVRDGARAGIAGVRP